MLPHLHLNLLAQAYPKSTVVGVDFQGESIALARKQVDDAGVSDRVNFEIATAQDFSGSDYDLVTTFDALHDMGDPVGAAHRILESLDSDGTWLLVEPISPENVEDTFNPVGRLYYSASTFRCVLNALSQSGGYALGAQAPESAVRQVVTDAGFTRFRRAAQTAFNNVYEVRP